MLWVADITSIPTWAGFLYLAVVLDAFSRRIVGWSMATTLHTQVVLDALDMALGQRRPSGVIHHSDQGSQYTSIAFGKRCREAAVRPSMGSVGDAYDNAMAESFFATLECELLDRRRFKTQAEARIAVFEFIEGFYNPRRRHSSLGYLSPIDYERRHDQRAADPSAHHRSAVLGAVKVRPGDGGGCVDAGATADLDRPCARRRQRRAGRDGKTNAACPAILLRESYRKDGKVRKRTLANLSRWPQHLVEGLRTLLRGGVAVAKAEDALSIKRSLPHGHVAAILGSARSLGLPALLTERAGGAAGRRCRDLVLAMLAERIIAPSSKLATVRALDPDTAASSLGEVFGLGVGQEREVYARPRLA